MGSKSRITQKLRQSSSFVAIEAELDRLNLPYKVNAATGSGHPFLLITLPGRVEPLKLSVACTPHQKTPSGVRVAYLRRALRAAGFEV